MITSRVTRFKIVNPKRPSLEMAIRQGETVKDAIYPAQLMNWYDAEQARQGCIATDQVRSVEVEARIDHENVDSCLPARFLEPLGVGVLDKRWRDMPDGLRQVEWTHGIEAQIGDLTALVSFIIYGDEVVLGRLTWLCSEQKQ